MAQPKRKLSLLPSPPMEGKGKTVQEGFKEFTTHCKIKNLSEKTLVYYQNYFEKFNSFLSMPHMNIKHMQEVTKDIVNDYILYLSELDTINDITVNTSLRAVRAFVYYWQSLGYCPNYKIMLIKADKQIKETYSIHELKRLLEKPDMKGDFSEYRNWVVINFLLATGVRVGELVSIRIGDIY